MNLIISSDYRKKGFCVMVIYNLVDEIGIKNK